MMENSTQVILSMRRIGKSFSGVTVLENVCLDLYAGEVHILAGENGAGKSTLMKILAGIHTEYEGEILLHDRAVRFRSPQHAAQQGISVIHQEMSLIGSLNVSDNIFLGRELAGPAGWMDYRRQNQKTQKLLGELGLELDPATPVGDFPVSVQQMIEIAKALAFDARIIIMDEPTSALAEPEVKKLFGIIDNLKARGCAIVYITHKMEEIYEIADRITVLRDGRYIGTAPAEELPQSKMVEWMIGRELTEQFPQRQSQIGPCKLHVRSLSIPDPAGTPRLAADRLSFEVHAGEIVGLAGLQGSGNSEVLHGLFGDFGPLPEAQIQINESEYVIDTPGHAIRSGLALLTNDRKENGLVLGMNVLQNTTLASLKKFSPSGWLRPSDEIAAAQRQAKKLSLRAAGLEVEVQTLSGGNQQKVVLAKWLETQPQVLLLDEPTRGVDVGAKHEIYKLMNDLTAQGMAILLITSEMPELLAMSDRILVLHRGRLTAAFTRQQATQEKILRAAMGETGLAEE